MSEAKHDIFAAVKSHLARAREGRRLLASGKTLADMTSPIAGLSHEELIRNREQWIARMKDLDGERLIWVYGNHLLSWERANESPDKGTSELQWRINAMKDEFESRGLSIPDIDVDKVRRGEYRPG